MRIRTSGDDPPSYSLNGSSLTQVAKQRDLGVIVTSNVSWSEHYSFICSNAYSSLHFLRKNFPPSSPTALKKVSLSERSNNSDRKMDEDESN